MNQVINLFIYLHILIVIMLCFDYWPTKVPTICNNNIISNNNNNNNHNNNNISTCNNNNNNNSNNNINNNNNNINNNNNKYLYCIHHIFCTRYISIKNIFIREKNVLLKGIDHRLTRCLNHWVIFCTHLQWISISGPTGYFSFHPVLHKWCNKRLWYLLSCLWNGAFK